MHMAQLVAVIMPNHNGGATIGQYIEVALASRYANFEVGRLPLYLPALSRGKIHFRKTGRGREAQEAP